MASPYQYPWVNFFSTPTASIDSTSTLIGGAISTSIIDSIYVCNTSDQDIFIDITILAERNLTPITTYRIKKFFLPKNESAELISPTHNQVNSVLILETGDTLFGNSDFSGNTFDCVVSGRQLLETA